MGMSYAEIARAINAEFKTDYSRCAAIGRARRLGLGFARLLDELASPVPKPPSPELYKLAKSQEALAKWLAADTALCGGRAARSVAAGARSRRLPLPLWW